jgi:hypothetical protein
MTLQSHHAAADVYAAFDGAVERLDNRLRRHKGRLSDRKRRADGAEGEAELAAEPARYAVVDPEAESIDGGNGAENAAAPIVAEMATHIATLSVGEAVARLDLGQKPVLMFRNGANGQFNVVYRRADGAIGWIDPGKEWTSSISSPPTASSPIRARPRRSKSCRTSPAKPPS